MQCTNLTLSDNLLLDPEIHPNSKKKIDTEDKKIVHPGDSLFCVDSSDGRIPLHPPIKRLNQANLDSHTLDSPPDKMRKSIYTPGDPMQASKHRRTIRAIPSSDGKLADFYKRAQVNRELTIAQKGRKRTEEVRKREQDAYQVVSARKKHQNASKDRDREFADFETEEERKERHEKEEMEWKTKEKEMWDKFKDRDEKERAAMEERYTESDPHSAMTHVYRGESAEELIFKGEIPRGKVKTALAYLTFPTKQVCSALKNLTLRVGIDLETHQTTRTRTKRDLAFKRENLKQLEQMTQICNDAAKVYFTDTHESTSTIEISPIVINVSVTQNFAHVETRKKLTLAWVYNKYELYTEIPETNLYAAETFLQAALKANLLPAHHTLVDLGNVLTNLDEHSSHVNEIGLKNALDLARGLTYPLNWVLDWHKRDTGNHLELRWEKDALKVPLEELLEHELVKSELLDYGRESGQRNYMALEGRPSVRLVEDGNRERDIVTAYICSGMSVVFVVLFYTYMKGKKTRV